MDDRIASLEARIRKLQDLEEIKQLQGHYVNCIVTVNWKALLDCFTEDAVVDIHLGKVQGMDQLKQMYNDRVSINQRGLEALFVVHPLITIDGDTARGSWSLFFMYAQPRKLAPRPPVRPGEDAPDWTQGFYDMEYRREGGRWKISRLKWRLRLMSPLTLAGPYPELGGDGGYSFIPEPLNSGTGGQGSREELPPDNRGGTSVSLQGGGC